MRQALVFTACALVSACGSGDDGASSDDATNDVAHETSSDASTETPSDASHLDAHDADAAADATIDAGPTVDKFGVREIEPTIAGGREWTLPDTADAPDDEWQPETNDVTKVSAGVFDTIGEDGQVRLNVHSPSGKAWWRNVEMTGYFTYVADHVSGGQVQHFELFARGERHSSSSLVGTDIDDGVLAPAGTATWPGYPYGSSSVNPHCLGTAYHGNVYPTGRVLFEKEVTHTEGYADQRGEITGSGAAGKGTWFGMKFILRNTTAIDRVHAEVWLDKGADGTWTKVTEIDDTAGGWPASTTTLDGCTAAPYGYTPAMLLTWAGPWVTFRSDSIEVQFKWLSVREIAPI